MKAHRPLFVRGVALATLLSFVVTSCGSRPKPASPTIGTGSPISDLVLVQTKDLPAGLDMRVSDGKQGAPAFDRATLAPAKKLPEAEANALLGRAKPITTDPEDKQRFALRAKSLPPPPPKSSRLSRPRPPRSPRRPLSKPMICPYSRQFVR